MDLRRSKVKEPTPWIDLAMLGVVAAFFGYSAFKLWNPPAPPTLRAAMRPPITRTLATVGTPTVVVPERSTQVFTLPPCASSPASPLHLATEASLLQVKGGICHRGETLRGRNETTQETLQVFPRGAEFSTHYFPLLPGRNRIVLEGSASPAARVLEVERAGK